MRPSRIPRVAPVVFALLVAVDLAPYSRAQDSSALINEELDKQVDLKLDKMLPDALREIENKTGVPLRADPAVWELLPWGEQTSVRATIQNQTLRQALTAITQRLGLTFSLGKEAVILQPMPALKRLGKRSTVQEMQALDLLASTPMPQVNGVPKVQNILTAIDNNLAATKGAALAVVVEVGKDVKDVTIELPRNATMLDALEQITRQTKATWYPWGKGLVVVPKEAQVRDQLTKSFTARYNRADVGQVLEDLRKRAGVDFIVDAGAIQKIPPEFRTVTVFWDNVPVGQALEHLSGLTGLQYQAVDKGVWITHPAPAVVQAAGAGGSNDPVVMMMTLENGSQVMIRQSQVPPEVLAYVRHRTQKEMDQLRQMAKDAGFTAPPATQPATQPAAPPAAPRPAPPEPPKDL
jgi:hypothetical protein